VRDGAPGLAGTRDRPPRGVRGRRRSGLPFVGCDRRDREPVAGLQNAHRRQLRALAHLGQRQKPRLAHDGHVHVQPARFVRWALGIEVGAGRIPLRGVGVGRAGHFGQAGHARLRARRVVEQHAVAGLHVVAHEVARLVVAHAHPGDALVAHQVVDRALLGLAFHQPVSHGSASRKRERCPSRTTGRIPEPREFRWARSAWLRVHLTRDDHTSQAMFQALALRASVQGNKNPCERGGRLHSTATTGGRRRSKRHQFALSGLSHPPGRRPPE
jgi:hypothetical protein